jgi:hypothetical protein
MKAGCEVCRTLDGLEEAEAPARKPNPTLHNTGTYQKRKNNSEHFLSTTCGPSRTFYKIAYL